MSRLNRILGLMEKEGKAFINYIRTMLSKKTKYGIKALAYIARQQGKKPVQTAEIAKSQNISHKFLGFFPGYRWFDSRAGTGDNN